MTFFVVLIGWIFSLSLHEFSHALVAYYGGDTSVREKGYLTFNPLKYTHPVYSMIIPIAILLMGGIGLPGGAVYIETWRLRSKNWISAVSLAGPASNLLLAILLSLLLNLLQPTASGIFPGLAFLALLQVTALVLNLIPVPPFDGFGAIEPHLSPSLRAAIEPIRGGAIWIVFIALWYVPVIGEMFWGFIFNLSELIGIPMDLVGIGYQQFFIWK